MSDVPLTPSGARIWAEASDGSRSDVTEAVQVLYDTLLSSMDWGSGFLSQEEVIPVAELAEACGFDNTAPRKYLKNLTRYLIGGGADRVDQAEAWLASHPELGDTPTEVGDEP